MFRKRNVSFIFIIHREKEKKRIKKKVKLFFFQGLVLFFWNHFGWMTLPLCRCPAKKKKKKKEMYKTRNRNHEGRKRRILFCFQETTSWQLHLVFQFGGGIGGECSQIRLLCSSQYTHTHVRKLFWIAMKFSLVFWGNIVVQRKHKKQNHFLKLE